MLRHLAMRVASAIFPTLVGEKAFKVLSRPQVRKNRPHELQILRTAICEDVLFEGMTLKSYRWGDGDKKVLLIHGWEGQAGNFADLIDPLLQKDFEVYAFDAPGHGFSDQGMTSIFAFSRSIDHFIQKWGIDTLISHSFGGVATTFALYENKDIFIRKYALLTCPDKFSERIDDVAKMVGISDHVKQILIRRLEKELEGDLEKFAVSEFVKEINVENALIIHDEADQVVPIQQSLNIAKYWTECKHHKISGTGHFRILRTPSVHNQIIDFIDG